MAKPRKGAKKAARKAGGSRRLAPIPLLSGGDECGADGYGKVPPYDPNLKVYTLYLTKAHIHALLAEFADPNQMFKGLLVKGSPFVALSISPTRAATD